MDIANNAERLGTLAKSVRANLGELRKAGANEKHLDAIDIQTDEMAGVGRRALEELQSLNDSLKASAFGLAGPRVVPKRGQPMPFTWIED